MSTEHVNTEGESVPDIVLEAFLKKENNPTKTVHIRLTGSSWEKDTLLLKFNELIRTYSNGYSYRVD